MFSGTDCNGTPAEYIEKLHEDMIREIPGTTEYDSIVSMIELKQNVSAAYTRLEEYLERDGLRQISTSALGVCLFMASALSLSPSNEDIHWLDLLLGTVEVLKCASRCNDTFSEHLEGLARNLIFKPFDYIAHDELVPRALSVFLNRKIRIYEEGGSGDVIIICPVQSREVLLLPAAEIEEAEGITITHITSAGPEHYNGVRVQLRRGKPKDVASHKCSSCSINLCLYFYFSLLYLFHTVLFFQIAEQP